LSREVQRERTAESNVVKVLRRLDRLKVSSNVELLDAVVKVGDGGVSHVVGAADLLRLESLVGLVDG
jgi:hypothetical protein